MILGRETPTLVNEPGGRGIDLHEIRGRCDAEIDVQAAAGAGVGDVVFDEAVDEKHIAVGRLPKMDNARPLPRVAREFYKESLGCWLVHWRWPAAQRRLETTDESVDRVAKID